MRDLDKKASVFVLKTFISGQKVMAEVVVGELDSRSIPEADKIKEAMDRATEESIEEFKEKLGISWDDIEEFKSQI